MKRVILSVVLAAVLMAGCVRVGKESRLTYIPVPTKESFSLGAFKPSETEYNFKHYDEGTAVAFLASVKDRFTDGDVVAVDGLKWKKNDGEWEAIPNPPVPVFRPGDNMDEHIRKYGEWIEDHPHLGYPPMPMENKE